MNAVTPDLAMEGYRTQGQFRNGDYLLVKPFKDRTFYRVNLTRWTCTCPAAGMNRACRHRDGLSLLLQTEAQLTGLPSNYNQMLPTAVQRLCAVREIRDTQDRFRDWVLQGGDEEDFGGRLPVGVKRSLKKEAA